MKKLCLILLFIILFCAGLRAQHPRRFYYNKNWVLTSKDSSVYFRESDFDTVRSLFHGTVEDFTKAGKLVMRGEYIDGVKEGEFSFYFTNGQLESTGLYKNNIRTGTWRYFYKNGIPKQEILFVGTNPRILFYNDSTGAKLLENGNGKWEVSYEEFLYPHTIKVEGQFKDGNRTGEWVCRLSNGDFYYKERYTKGQFKSGYLTDAKGNKKREYQKEFENKFLPPYKLYSMETFNYVKGLSPANYPFLKFLQPRRELNQSDESTHTFAEKQPEFPGGTPAMSQFLMKNIHYPTHARPKVDGIVYVSFVVEKDGTLSEFQIAKGIGDEYNAEAIRVIKSFPTWIPGMQNGKAIKVKFILPIAFHLTR